MSEEWTVISKKNKYKKNKSSKDNNNNTNIGKRNETVLKNALLVAGNETTINSNIFEGMLESYRKSMNNLTLNGQTVISNDAIIVELVEQTVVALQSHPYVIALEEHLSRIIYKKMLHCTDNNNNNNNSVSIDISNSNNEIDSNSDRDGADSVSSIVELVILGVGKFMESYTSFLQLALAVVISRIFNGTGTGTGNGNGKSSKSSGTVLVGTEEEIVEAAKVPVSAGIRVAIFDPVMTPEETRVCTDTLQFSIMPNNSYGKIGNEDKNVISIYYMPHCPYQLYNNILWANWDRLQRVVVVGNR